MKKNSIMNNGAVDKAACETETRGSVIFIHFECRESNGDYFETVIWPSGLLNVFNDTFSVDKCRTSLSQAGRSRFKDELMTCDLI